MAHRIERHISRGPAIAINLDGRSLTCFEGETIATVLLSHDILTFRRDNRGMPRGPVCNMGVCYDCMVDVKQEDGQFVRRRACMTPVTNAMSVRIGGNGQTS